MDKRPYRIAELAYRPWDEYPWLVIRTGGIIDQGGMRPGTEEVGFKTIEEAVIYIKSNTERDLFVIDDLIKNKESWK